MIEPFLLERFFARHEFTAKHLLCASDCESTTVAELLALEPGAAEGLAALRLGYTEPRGSPSLRAAIAALYAPPERGGPGAGGILVHAGAQEAILNLFHATVSPGDRVVVNEPCYQSLATLPRHLGATVVPWRLREDGKRWFLDPDELADLLAAGAAMVVINFPHNPTGALATADEFAAIVEGCRRAGAILLVDEVYRGLEADPARRLPNGCEAYENAVSLNVLSKAPGLAGLRIGWLATRRADILDRVAQVKDYNSICSSAPSELLAGVAVRAWEGLVERARSLCAANLGLLRDFVARHPGFVEWTPPEASSICFPRLAGRAAEEFAGDSERMALELLGATGVLLLPGSDHGYDPRFFRLGFGRADFPEALGLLEGWVKDKGWG